MSSSLRNRREQKLQDVPLAVTAISGEALREKSISSVVDLGIGRVPGLSVTANAGSETTAAISFRGLAASDASQATQGLARCLLYRRHQPGA